MTYVDDFCLLYCCSEIFEEVKAFLYEMQYLWHLQFMSDFEIKLLPVCILSLL